MENSNRTIKFRAWDIEDKIMHYDIQDRAKFKGGFITGTKHFNYFLEHPCFKIMQFTGFHDKNGTEIYCSDILEWETIKPNDNGNWDGKEIQKVIDLVEWNVEQGKFDGLIGVKQCKVIGNIHEHPHLI